MINGDLIKNFLLILFTGAMFFVVILVAMRAIDKIADRDCERGITSACKYVPVN